MPVFKSGPNRAPAWCTLQYFEIVDLLPGDTRAFARLGEREKLIVLQGQCDLEVTGSDASQPGSSSGQRLAIDTSDGEFIVTQVTEPCRILRICGRWGPGCETFGQFTPAGRTPPRDRGDDFDYPKTNGIDRHYHDCDEYWIITEGRGRAVSEGIFYDVGPGDCVATGMGHHHDFPEDYEPVKAVYMETDLEGRKRRGHLWEYKHGAAEPVPDRV